MNKTIASLALALLFVVQGAALSPHHHKAKASKHTAKHALRQHKEITGRLPSVVDLRTHKHKRRVVALDQGNMPVIANVSPVYLQQGNPPGTAITASGGFLYVVVGQRLYKVSEKTMKTVQVSTLAKLEAQAASMSHDENPLRLASHPTRHKQPRRKHKPEPAAAG